MRILMGTSNTGDKIDRRQEVSVDQKSLYQQENLHELIEKERREDELDRLRDVLEQKATWRNVVLFCGALNIVLILLAISGVIWP